jgi:hypothetical protein
MIITWAWEIYHPFFSELFSYIRAVRWGRLLSRQVIMIKQQCFSYTKVILLSLYWCVLDHVFLTFAVTRNQYRGALRAASKDGNRFHFFCRYTWYVKHASVLPLSAKAADFISSAGMFANAARSPLCLLLLGASTSVGSATWPNFSLRDTTQSWSWGYVPQIFCRIVQRICTTCLLRETSTAQKLE